MPTETKGSKGKNPIRGKIAAVAEKLNESRAGSNQQKTPEEDLFNTVASEPQPVEGKRNMLKRQGAMVWDHDMGESKRPRSKGDVT